MKIRKGPDGVHFFDRNSGTNLLLDEVVSPPETWSRSPRQVSIALTNACDLDCLHCYAPKTKAILEGRLAERWMYELDQWEFLLKDFLDRLPVSPLQSSTGDLKSSH